MEPVSSLASVTREKGIEVIEKWITKDSVATIEKKASVLTCFEVLEHVFDPKEFLSLFSKLLLPGGLFMLSFPSASGFDVRTMWKDANAAYPPHHINSLTVEGVRALVDRLPMFEITSITTPGKLDVNIVKTATEENKITSESIGNFFDYLYWRGDAKILDAFQSFLREHLLSSHVFLVLKKKHI